MCLYHVAWFKGPDAPDMWAERVSREARELVAQGYAEQGRVSREARQIVAQAYAVQGLETEIALLRLLIRDSAAQGRTEVARRTIETLARVLLSRAKGRGVGPSSSANLDAVLEQLGVEPDDRAAATGLLSRAEAPH
jgi:hypothetical protein